MIAPWQWLVPDGVLPHGFCYQWKPVLLWLHATSDSLIALAYFSIPIVLFRLARKRRDLPFHWAFLCFALFIASCGATHLMEVWTLWIPSYWSSGAMKAFTAFASLLTAALLIHFLPQAMNLPSPEQLKAANQELQQQAEVLRRSEERFRQMADNIQEIFWMLDPVTKEAVYVSPAFESICELPVESLYAHPTSYRELIHADDRARVLDALEGLQSANRFDEEFRIVCPSGTVKWMRSIASAVRDRTNTVCSVVGTVHEITARKEMEAVLRESEDRYRDLVEHSTDLICTHTLEGRLLTVNELPVKLLGYSREELLNKPMRDFLPPEARAQFDASFQEIQRNGYVKGLMVVLTKWGERRVWEYHNTLRTDTGGPPIVRGIAHDVTEQRRMEKALRASEEKFAKAFLASPYPIVISTIDGGRLMEVNEAFLKITGYSREECIDRTSFELGFWTSATDRNAIRNELNDTGRVQTKQIIFKMKSGQRLSVNYSAEIIELGGKKCLLSVCEDITERKQAEAKLLEYEKAVEGVEEMIAVIDRDYRYLLANQAFTQFRGLAKEQVVGHLVSEIHDEDTFQQILKPKLDAAFQGHIVRFETSYIYPGIGRRDLFVSYFPVVESGRTNRVVCVLQDITERKQANEEVRRLSGQLLRLQDEERRKIARDLHDSTGQELVALTTTLSQVYESVPASSRSMRRTLSRCRLLAERCLGEVRTLSYLLHPPMLDQSGLEDAIRHFAEGFVKRTGIAVATDVSPCFGRLSEEAELGLFRVVQESLVNIQRHSGSRTAKILLTRDQTGVVLCVSDNGHGILPNGSKKNGTSRPTPGVGIPSMEERAKQVGGRLEIQSNNRGTCVQLTVPIHA